MGGAAVFAGSGGGLNAGHTGLELAADAVGFQATGATFKLVMATGAASDGANAGDTYLGIEAGITEAQLMGVSGLELWASGTVKVNRATDADGSTPLTPRMNWLPATTTNDGGSVLVVV